MIEMEESDYIKYRGKCKEYCQKAVLENPSLRMIRGYYYCPFWGKQAHWWCVDPAGKIVDPTKDQFPSKGIGEYVEFDGMCECEYCGTSIHESKAYFEEHHVYCCYEHYGKDIGVF